MSSMLIGYARCSTERQDLIVQRKALRELGVENKRIYVDRGLAGNPPRSGLEKALGAVRRGDTLVVARLGRLARSVRDARSIGEELAARGVKLSLGGIVYDPKSANGRCFFELLSTFAEFEADLLQLRTREGMAVARANGRLKGKRPKLTASQHAQLLELRSSGEHTISELAERLSVSRATIYRALDRAAAQAT
jgi:DNA invertase Pin-like site-specific DNA recombinase